MEIKENNLSITQILCLAAYYGMARYLPKSQSIMGGVSKRIRAELCKHIFKKAGKNINIERNVIFGRGTSIEIGNNSGIGINAVIPSDTIIGDNVMMGPNCYILMCNHSFSDISKPMNRQGTCEKKQTIIEDDVWIGRNVTMTPGRVIKRGTIIGACSVLTKDFPEYSIVGGNPAKLIRSRLENNNN